MAQRFYEPIARIFTNAGAVGVGYKYYFYQTGTTTPVTTYQDDGLSVANTNPVISDSNGRFPEIWYSDLSQLKLIVKDSSDNTLETVDPVGATASAVSLNDFDVRPTSYWGLTAGTSTVYTLVANPTISAYDNTQTFVIQVHTDCGNSPTLSIDGLSALNWKKYTQQGTKVALKANDLRASQRYFCINDGVDIVCLNPSSLPILLGSATALTIATGVVTLTNNSSSYTIDTEGAAASDDVDTINGGQDGQVIFLLAANGARSVILKSGTGNIVTPHAGNLALSTITPTLLRYNGTAWRPLIAGIPVRTTNSAVATTTTQIPYDDSMPQNTEGTEVMSQPYTASSAASVLKVDVVCNLANSSGAAACTAALFQDSAADAKGAAGAEGSAGGVPFQIVFTTYVTAGTTSSTTLKVRVGPSSATTLTFNGSGGARRYGGVMASSITITEFFG